MTKPDSFNTLLKHVDKREHQNGAFDAMDAATYPQRWHRCVVVATNPRTKTCTVVDEQGRWYSSLPFPVRNRDPESGAGMYSIPKAKTEFLLSTDAGYPMLMEYNPALLAQQADDASRVTAVKGSDEDPFIEPTSGNLGYGPKGSSPGDHILAGDDGQLVGVLAGGTVVVKASELAQLICMQGGDLVRLLARNCEILTGFGKLEFINDGNRTSMKLTGGANYSDQTSPLRNDTYTIHTELGADGDLVNFRITNPQGQELAKIHYTPDGDVNRKAKNVSEEISGVESRLVRGSQKEVVEGTVTQRVGGKATLSYAQDRVEEVFGSNSTSAINDQVINAQRDIKLTAGRNLNTSVSGDITNVPGATAMKTTVTNGSWVVDIGNPAGGDVGSPLSSFELRAFLGDVTLSTVGGRISLKSVLPDSVLLGGETPAYHALLFEMFDNFMQQLGLYLDSHIHPTGVGPSGPPAPPQIFSPVRGSLPLLRSRYVTFGG